MVLTMNDPNFLSRLAGEPVRLRMQTVPTNNVFHPTEPAFMRVPAFLTGQIERAADGVPIRAEVTIYPDGARHWVPCDIVLTRDGIEPMQFTSPAEG